MSDLGQANREGGTEAGFLGAAFQADGAYASGWGILAGGTFEPASIEAVKAGRTQMRRAAGNYPASVNEENWPRTGSACIPMALDDAIELGKIKRGDLVVMLASGLGWNQTAAAVRM